MDWRTGSRICFAQIDMCQLSDQLSGGASKLAVECIYWMEIDLILRMENDMQMLI